MDRTPGQRLKDIDYLLEQTPDEYWLYINKAQIFMDIQEYKKAIEVLNDAMRIFGLNEDKRFHYRCCFLLASANTRIGNLKEGIINFVRAKNYASTPTQEIICGLRKVFLEHALKTGEKPPEYI